MTEDDDICRQREVYIKMMAPRLFCSVSATRTTRTRGALETLVLFIMAAVLGAFTDLLPRTDEPSYLAQNRRLSRTAGIGGQTDVVSAVCFAHLMLL